MSLQTRTAHCTQDRSTLRFPTEQQTAFSLALSTLPDDALHLCCLVWFFWFLLQFEPKISESWQQQLQDFMNLIFWDWQVILFFTLHWPTSKPICHLFTSFYLFTFVRPSGVLSTSTAFDYPKEFNTIQVSFSVHPLFRVIDEDQRLLHKTTLVNPNISGREHCWLFSTLGSNH